MVYGWQHLPKSNCEGLVVVIWRLFLLKLTSAVTCTRAAALASLQGDEMPWPCLMVRLARDVCTNEYRSCLR